MKRTQKKRFGIGIRIAILVLIGTIAFEIYHRWRFVEYLPYQYEESADALDNPYIGWYTIQGYLLSEDATFSLPLPQEDDARKMDISASQTDLVLLEINLKNYANCDLPDTAISQVDSILSAWSQTGSQIILRFLYDWDGQNMQSEPKELSQILRHMEQVGPIINTYASSVYLLQGIFVGNYGEMNNTIHMGDGQMQVLMEKLADVTDPSIFLSVRTPAQLRSIVKSRMPIDENLAFNGTLSSRLGLYNDGMLGSANDTGTYGDKKASDATTNDQDAWIREDELAFQNELCQYVPNGGEVIIENEYNDFDNAVQDLATMHVSYLNSAYDAAVLDKWKAAVYHTEGSDVFDGMNGYDYIERHLGYRYVLRSSKLHFHPLLDNDAVLTVGVENVGFANCYRPLEVTLAVVSDDTGKCVDSIDMDTDPRFWNSGETATFTVPIAVRNLEEDTTYTLYLLCEDAALGRTILFGNEQKLTEYGYEVGKVTVASTTY